MDRWAAPDHKEIARRYDADVWSKGLYDGFGSNQKQNAVETKLVLATAEKLRSVSEKPHLVELAAGSGGQALWFAEQGFAVTAVEYSPVAVQRIRQEILQRDDLIQRRIKVVQADMFDFVQNMEISDAIYAAVIVHTLTAEERRDLYALCSNKQRSGGLISLSFKAHGGSLEKHGSVVEETSSGPIVLGNEGIPRLCVTDPNPLIEEIQRAGYTVNEQDVLSWSVEGYNLPGKNEHFIGFIGTKS